MLALGGRCETSCAVNGGVSLGQQQARARMIGRRDIERVRCQRGQDGWLQEEGMCLALRGSEIVADSASVAGVRRAASTARGAES